jgi:hypothetical protein
LSFIRTQMIKHNIPYKKKVKYTCDESFFERDTEEAFYWAGFLAAGGNVSKRGDITLSVGEKDTKHLYKFKKILKQIVLLR